MEKAEGVPKEAPGYQSKLASRLIMKGMQLAVVLGIRFLPPIPDETHPEVQTKANV